MLLNVEKYLHDLEELVNTESHSKMPEGTRNVAMLLKEKFDQLGWLTEIIDLGSQSGPCLKVLNKPSEKYDVMLLGHMDTVFPRGTVAARPFKIVGGHYTGPGGSDGNFTAALGIPTIDGLGPIGGNAHSEREYGEIDSLAPRFELLYRLVNKLTQK